MFKIKPMLGLLLAFLFSSSVMAQIKGSVVDNKDGSPVIGASVLAVGTTKGSSTDIDGNFSIDVSEGTMLEISFIGYEKVRVAASKGMKVTLSSSSTSLDEVIISVGSRNTRRSLTDTPVPVDIVSAKDLISTGQTTFDKALQYKIPSFNTVQTPVNDATSLLDPYEIRNMGPSRTLILINGKRKNMSSLLYTQTSPGRGETGADISAIPTGMIKRVEILRDGASAQYGSDAIAGVMNIILKDDVDQGNITLKTGVSAKGDGGIFGVAVNNGSALGKNGFINYTLDLSQVGQYNRPGTVDAAGEAADFGASLADVQSFLAKMPDAGNINGSPKTTAMKFAFNTAVKVSPTGEVYANAGYVYKKVNSFANYRTPYWRTEKDFPYLKSFFPNGPNGSYIGYVPTFEGDLQDYNATIGFKSTRNNWNTDVSFTTGGNQQTYTVSNSQNRSSIDLGDSNGNGIIDGGEISLGNKYKENSPLVFYPGGTRFTHNVGNIDISRRLSDKVGLGFGSEFRTENFTVIEGQLSSYEGGGGDSFAGNNPLNSGTFNRFNLGGYADLLVDFTDNFLINATARYENYSDFGDAFVWKLSSRYKLIGDKLTLRASASTGFKAPTLHQIYTQKAQYSFVPGKGIQVGGLVSNVSTQASLLGLPSLKPEKSTNFTLGLGLKPNKNLNVTLDYYDIAVKDRIILGSEITGTAAGNTALDKILIANNLSDLSFFANAMNTRTSGIDVVVNYRGIDLGNGKLAANLAGNYTIQNKRVGAVKNPAIVQSAGQSVSNATQEALFFTSRPRFKAILGFDYEVGKLGLSFNNTLFGPVKFKQQGLDDNLYTEFKTKIVSDLAITYELTEKATLAVNINNLFNILPEWSFKAENAKGEGYLKDAAFLKNQSNLITFNQRYSQMTYDGYHFSQLGTLFNTSLNIRF